VEIKIMSQKEAEEWSYNQWMEVTLLVSILGTHAPTPNFYRNPRIIDMISVSFDDIHEVHGDQTLLSEEDCLRIGEFILNHFDQVETIVIHCSTGESRSAAIAFAVCRLLGLDDRWIFESPKYSPNTYCVKKLNRVLELGLSEEEIVSRFEYKKRH
jgi:predicted protein tyrosine phosphatase